MSRRIQQGVLGILAGILGGFAWEVGALPIIVDQDATYRYINATAATNMGAPAADWFTPGFDDSAWFTGQAPFGNGFGADTSNVNDPYDGLAPPLPAAFTAWTANTDPFLRIEFQLAAPTALTVWMAVDNGIGPFPQVAGSTGMYINGVEGTGSVNAEGLGFRWEHVFDIGAEFTFAGTNLFALQLEDHGGQTAFAMVITEDDPLENPDFSTNPPPTQTDPPDNGGPPPVNGVPEPGTLALLGLGLASIGVATRRRRRSA